MAVLPILRWPDPRLSQVCADVTGVDDIANLATDMLATMYAAPGRGLAAPQIGVLKRLFVMDATWKEGRPAPIVMINPVILMRSDEKVSGPESCLSIPGLSLTVERSAEITIRWTDLQGAECGETLRGFAALCAQHEQDHLDGIVTLHHLSPEARAAALAGYMA